jgi:hypothetical protein
MVDLLEARMAVQPTETRPREKFVAVGTLVNVGTEPVTLNLAPLSAPSLALEIVEAQGAPVLLPPPPVPGGEVRTVELAPGQGYTVQFAGFVPQWVPVGTYRARLRYVNRASAPPPREWTGQVVSDWAEFRIIG